MTQRELLDFLSIVSSLKTNTRHCYTAKDRKESVADHCWRLSLIPMLIENEFSDVDINKVIRMCLIHDLGEAITGDIPCFEKTDNDRNNERKALSALLSRLPENTRTSFNELYDEMYALETKEAKLYKALDNLEAVISHNDSDLDTWLPFEYELNLTYGENTVAWNDWLRELKAECNRDTIKKVEEGK